ncbi:MAG TPA: hypothetical protein PKN75_02770 [Bacteroidia bacterium]|nr:hypothetical protein [Bacteroidia bacterium]HNU32489.1 hypothetical protein [Bacteroidia bacterium]
MKFAKIKNPEFYKRALELIAIGNRGVQLALIENKKMGLPNVLSIGGKIFYQMPDGTITTKSPFKKKKK